MSITATATDIKTNFGKYLLLAAENDIFISKNGKIIAKLSSPYKNRVDIVNSLAGIIPPDANTDDILSGKIREI